MSTHGQENTRSVTLACSCIEYDERTPPGPLGAVAADSTTCRRAPCPMPRRTDAREGQASGTRSGTGRGACRNHDRRTPESRQRPGRHSTPRGAPIERSVVGPDRRTNQADPPEPPRRWTVVTRGGRAGARDRRHQPTPDATATSRRTGHPADSADSPVDAGSTFPRPRSDRSAPDRPLPAAETAFRHRQRPGRRPATGWTAPDGAAGTSVPPGPPGRRRTGRTRTGAASCRATPVSPSAGDGDRDHLRT